MDNRWYTQNKSFPCNDWTDTCGCDLQQKPRSQSQTEVKWTWQVQGGLWPNKSPKKREPSAVNHIPHTKLSQLYSTEKTSDQSSESACLDREGTSSLTGLGFDKESGAPWECARWAWDSHFKTGKSLLFFFFCCHRPRRSPGVLLSPFSIIFSIKDVEWGSQAIVVWSFQVTNKQQF